jgi:hypothetical protein
VRRGAIPLFNKAAETIESLCADFPWTPEYWNTVQWFMGDIPSNLKEPAVPMILRLSQELCTKIKAGTLKTMPLDDNPYADWSCHLFAVDRTQYILVSNTQSLYSCVLYARGITNDGVFIERVLSTLREFMEDDGQSFSYQRFIAPVSGTVSFAKALNRSVVGSMNDLIGHAVGRLEYGDISPHELGFHLNDNLLSALAASKAEKYGTPNEAFRRLGDAKRQSVV